MCHSLSNLRNAIISIYYHQGEFNFQYKAVVSLFQGHQEAKEEHEGEEEKVDILQLFAKAQERYDNEVSDWFVYFSFSDLYFFLVKDLQV